MNANRKIFEFMHPEKCWHEHAPDRWTYRPGRFWFSKAIYNPDNNKCIKCGKDVMGYQSYNGITDVHEQGICENKYASAYDSESSPRSLLSEVEQAVIAKFGAEVYLMQLMVAVKVAHLSITRKIYLGIATASAADRCKAILAVLEQEEKP